MTDDHENYREQIEDRIRDWSRRIGDLKVQADQAPAEKKIGMLNQIADLTQRKEKLMTMVEDLKRAEENDSRDRIVDALESEVADLDDAYRESIRFFH